MSDGAPTILSAFTRDNIRGSIYIEASTLDMVHRALKGIGGVIHSRSGAASIQHIPDEDHIPLLTMEAFLTSITTGSWVRIKKRGRHVRDLAFVSEIDKNRFSTIVLLPPRICFNRKRKWPGRVEANLFDADAVKQRFGSKSLRQLNGRWIFRKTIHVSGLCEDEYSLLDLTGEGVNPTDSELDLFRRSRHPLILECLEARLCELHVGDRASVILGTYYRLKGRITTIHENSIVSIQVYDFMLELDTVDVHISEINKYFTHGDLVGVHYGLHRGAEGLVIDLINRTAVIYVRKFISLYGELREQPGEEVSLVSNW
jgi:transcription elongation factor SPT5